MGAFAPAPLDPETQPLMMLLENDLFEVIKFCIDGSLRNIEINLKEGSAACVALSSEGYPGEYRTGEKINGIEKRDDEEIVAFQAGTRRSGKNILTDGGRVLGITAYGESQREARAKAYLAIGENGVHFSGMQYRVDIAKE